MRVLGTIVEVAALPMLDLRQDLPFRGSIAPQLVGDDHPRGSSCRIQQRTKEPQGCPAIPPLLYQDIVGGPMLVDSSPQVVLHAIHLDEDFVEVPLRTDLGPLLSQPRCVESPEVSTPLPNSLVREPDSPLAIISSTSR